MPLQTHELMPCPNRFKITGTLSDKHERIRENVFHTSPYDNDVSLSCGDLQFLRIMEDGIHKNETGHWEMPLPFRQREGRMPNNYVQALNRLRGLLHTLNRKPQMKKDYFPSWKKSSTEAMHHQFYQKTQKKSTFRKSVVPPTIWGLRA